MPVTKEERQEIEREVHSRMMRDLGSGDVLLMGHKLKDVIDGIHNMNRLVPGSVDERIREIVRLKAAERAVEAAKDYIASPNLREYEDPEDPDRYLKRVETARRRTALVAALDAYEESAVKNA